MSESILDMEEGLRKSYARSMESLLQIAESSYTISAIVVCLSMVWHQLVEKAVPKPYLDEFFHIQQAELYLQGRFSEWHPKITTPPGLYLLSLLYLGCLSLVGFLDQVEIANLRRTNAWAASLFPFCVKSVLRGVVIKYDGLEFLDRTLPWFWSLAELNHAALNICLFPPLFFFLGLYYTDVWSALSVIITLRFHQKKATRSMVLAGIASLFFRQTNIFWVGIYLGGLEVVRKLERHRPSASWETAVFGSWRYCRIYDPLIFQASFGDYAKTALSIVAAATGSLKTLIPYLKPYLIMLGAFGYFVIWNGGVVLGDKENHVPSLHLAQMLYIWPYIMFFSFPLLYPYIFNAIIPQKYLPSPIRVKPPGNQLPRFMVALPIMAIMLLIVHFNTIVHPFTSADNRHYTFYVFRLLLRHSANKYLVVPVYFICAWAAITAFGGLPNVQTPPNSKQPGGRHAPQPKIVGLSPSSEAYTPQDRGHHISTFLIWLLATALSLVTAPLVEPRYFIVPWLVWRLHIASPWPTGEEAYKKRKEKVTTIGARCKAILYDKHDHRLWLETIWFLVVNWGVGYVFLKWEFEWEHEKGKVQRFMW